MARAQLRKVIREVEPYGRGWQNSAVYVKDVDTGELLTGLTADQAGTIPLEQPLISNAQCEVEAWIAASIGGDDYVILEATDNDGTAYHPDDSSRRYTFPTTSEKVPVVVPTSVVDEALTVLASKEGTTLGETTYNGTVVTLDFETNWGIDSGGDAYYDPAGAAPGEEAILIVNPDGSLAVVAVSGSLTEDWNISPVSAQLAAEAAAAAALRASPGFPPASLDPLLVRGSDTQNIGGVNQGVYFRSEWGGVIDTIRLEITTQSGNISAAVFRNSGVGTNAVPAARLGTSGAIACPAVGVRDITLDQAVDMEPGDWLFLSADNTTAAFRSGLAGPAANPTWMAGRCYNQVTAHPAPANAEAITPYSSKPILLVGVV